MSKRQRRSGVVPTPFTHVFVDPAATAKQLTVSVLPGRTYELRTDLVELRDVIGGGQVVLYPLVWVSEAHTSSRDVPASSSTPFHYMQPVEVTPEKQTLRFSAAYPCNVWVLLVNDVEESCGCNAGPLPANMKKKPCGCARA